MHTTLHWVKDSLHHEIQRLYTLSDDVLAQHFVDHVRSPLKKHTQGIMDVMFVSACFPFPEVEMLGDLFWCLARQLICLDVPNVDVLNSLLWGTVLPQTVLMLRSGIYVIDSGMDPVTVPVTFQGSRNPEERTTVFVYRHTTLIFVESVRFFNLDFDHVASNTNSNLPGPYLITMMGITTCVLEAFFFDVSVKNAGVFASNFASVRLENTAIYQAPTAILLKSVDQFFFGSRDVTGRTTPSLIASCQLAIQTPDVDDLILEDIQFTNVCCVFDARVLYNCEIRKCQADRQCILLGRIVLSKKACIFIPDVKVIRIYVFCLFCVILMDLVSV